MTTRIAGSRGQRMLLPVDIDEWVSADDPVRFVADFVAQLDAKEIELVSPSLPGGPGRPHYDPKLLLSVWVYGYVRRVRTLRTMEQACRERVTFRWLTGNEVPDHNTLWRFWKANRRAIENVYRRTVRVAHGVGLVEFVAQAVDGTKIRAASSDQTATSRTALLQELGAQLEKLLDEQVQNAARSLEHSDELALDGAARLTTALQDPQARIEAIRSQMAALEQDTRNRIHPLEPDALTVKCKEGLRLGHNAQAVVEPSGIVVAADVADNVTDHGQMVPMLDRVVEVAGALPDHLLADAGYENAEHLARATERGVDVVGAAKPSDVEPGDSPYHVSKFHYDADQDCYLCPQGQVLRRDRQVNKNGKAAKIVRLAVIYSCRRGPKCPVRAQCTKSAGGRTIHRQSSAELVKRHLEKMRTPEAKALYGRRKGWIELLFAQLKWVDGFTRFSVRGRDKVRTQWLCVVAARNLRILARLWAAERRLAAA